jgi:hypothetical protein
MVALSMPLWLPPVDLSLDTRNLTFIEFSRFNDVTVALLSYGSFRQQVRIEQRALAFGF